MESKKGKLEQSLERLEEISRKMDDDSLSLEEALALYTEAGDLIKTCKADMQKAEDSFRQVLAQLDMQ
jgi:exodeoxyribonuclease VII small subunit